MQQSTLYIQPSARLDFVFDWSPWLEDGESIVSHTAQAAEPLVLESSSVAAGEVTAWVQLPGSAAPGLRLALDCQITSSLGRTDSRRMVLVVARR